MNKKVICAGHVCIDITPVFDEQRRYSRINEALDPGSLVYMDGVSVHTGGSVANTGLAMKLLGNDVRLMGKVGDDAFGGMIRDIFSRYGAGGLLTEKGERTSYSVVLAIPGLDRIFLHDPGANNSFSLADIPWDEIGDEALLHFGYPPLMRQMYADEGDTLRELFKTVKEKGIATSLDLAAVDPHSEAGRADWNLILQKVLPYVDFFEPSFEELFRMIDKNSREESGSGAGDKTKNLDLMKYAKPLAERCIEMGCAAVLIKCGISGMYFKTAEASRISRIGKNLCLDQAAWTDKEGSQACYEAEIVRSATGSGDVSIAAYLSAVLSGADPFRCAQLAAAEGAASVTAYDALGGILSLDELSRRIKNGWKVKGE